MPLRALWRTLLCIPLLTAALLWAAAAAAQDVLPVPTLSGRVIDQTATLKPEQAAALRTRLDAWLTEVAAQLPTPNPHHDSARDR